MAEDIEDFVGLSISRMSASGRFRTVATGSYGLNPAPSCPATAEPSWTTET